MKIRNHIPFSMLTGMILLAVFAVFGAMGNGNEIAKVPQGPAAYVESGLQTADSPMLSVIVTAGDSAEAASAIDFLGGTVSSALWLIDAVAATIPAEHLTELANTPGIVSIVNNKSVKTAEWIVWEGSLATDIASPAGVDVGANLLHTDTFGSIAISGEGIGIAVLDTGLKISDDLYSASTDAIRFDEQVDFVGDGTCSEPGGRQKENYCRYRKLASSFDHYGHGTHVSSIIGNRLYESNSGEALGVAPGANLVSVRVLGDDGTGTYEDVIEGIQHVVTYGHLRNVRIINLSLSATATTPYFIDPLNRAVEAAWAAGFVVVAAAGNNGPNAETITVPGNDPYVITVGAIDTNNTPMDWSDDTLPPWSATGPTLDNFIKPDVLAPGSKIVALIDSNSLLVQQHPDYEPGVYLLRMSGTSMSTAVTSGVVALMLEQNNNLTPDEVKFRLMYSAQQSTDGQTLGLNFFQQGAGRIWAPDAVLGTFPDGGAANANMDIAADLAHGWGYYDENGDPVLDDAELAHHYMGPVRKLLSDDGGGILYYVDNGDGTGMVLGAADAKTMEWSLATDIPNNMTWSVGQMVWSGGQMVWSGGEIEWYTGPLFDGSGLMVWSGGVLTWNEIGLFDANGLMVWSGGDLFDANGLMVWSGGQMVWSGGLMLWSGGQLFVQFDEPLFDANGVMVWSGGQMVWSGAELFDPAGQMVWSGAELFDASGQMVWSGGQMVWSGGEMLWSGGQMVWSGGQMVWSGGQMLWSGGQMLWSGGLMVWSGGQMLWSGAETLWSGGLMVWSGGEMLWSGGQMLWSGGQMVWSGGQMLWSGGQMVWSGSAPPEEEVAATNWVNDLEYANTMFVSDIDSYTWPTNNGKWRGAVMITVMNGTGEPVEGAKVFGTGTLSNGKSANGKCVTDDNGQCYMKSPEIPNQFNYAHFEVTNILEKSWGFIYNENFNADPENDSDGTTIIVASPY